MNQPQSDEAIHRYLLGLSNEAECDEVERYYLTGTDGYDRLGAAEDELIEDYLDGRLDAEEKHGFEYRFLNAPQRRQRLNFTRVLRAAVHRNPAETRQPGVLSRLVFWFQVPALGRMQWGAAAGLAMALLGCGFLLLQNRNLSHEASIARGERQHLAEQNDELRRELQVSAQRSSSPPTPVPELPATLVPSKLPATLVPSELPTLLASESPIVSVMLSPGLTRSGAPSPRISIPHQAHLAKFKLEVLTSDYRVYRALVRLAEGEELLSQSNLRPSSSHEVTLLLPADLLRSSDYQILLAGRTSDGNYEPIATYSFRIVR